VKHVTMNGVSMTVEAAKLVEETGCNPAADVEALRAGRQTEEGLLALCLSGADPDREQGWRDYVRAVVLAAESAS
jgi:hypothetical protein